MVLLNDQYSVFDIHTHIFPDIIAQKASDSIGSFYGLKMEHDGTLTNLIHQMDIAGIRRSCVHSVAITPRTADSINHFILDAVKQYPDRLVGFAAIHPDIDHIEDYIDSVIKMGFRGFKIHPDMQHFALDSKPAMEMFSLLEDRMPVIIHTGDPRYSYSNPVQMKKVMDHFPRLKCVCAHLGGWGQWEEAWKMIAGYENVFVDTSSSLYAMTPQEAANVIRHYNIERVLFGTDYPMWNPLNEMERFYKIPLQEYERKKILHDNAEQFLSCK